MTRTDRRGKNGIISGARRLVLGSTLACMLIGRTKETKWALGVLAQFRDGHLDKISIPPPLAMVGGMFHG